MGRLIKDGIPQRFCQQCGRFHLLADFDANKRYIPLRSNQLNCLLLRCSWAHLPPRTCLDSVHYLQHTTVNLFDLVLVHKMLHFHKSGALFMGMKGCSVRKIGENNCVDSRNKFMTQKVRTI